MVVNFKKLSAVLVVLIAVVAMAFTFVMKASAEGSTPADAQAMAEKAQAFYKENGSVAAFKAFSESPDFHENGLYVYVLNTDGVMIAHGKQKALINKNMKDTADITGNYFVREIIKIKDTGWVDYYWNDESTGKAEKKRVYAIRFNDMFFCVGIYVEE